MAKKLTQLHKVKDVEQLREVARLLENENNQLHLQLQKLARRVDALEGQDARTLQLEIERLKRALDGERTKHNAKKSERRRPHRRTNTKPPEERAPETGGRRNEQFELPTSTTVCELTNDERTCPCCGGLADIMQGAYETSEVIDVVERSFTVVTMKREKAVHGCSCAPVKIVTAPGLVKAVAKGRFSLDFAVMVAVSKYHDHMPLQLQSEQMARMNLTVRPDVLWNQLEHQAPHWEPTYEAIRRGCLESDCVSTDDTSWPMLERGRKTWHAFVLNTPELTFIEIAPRKTHQRVIDLLTHPERGPYAGVVMCDGASNFTKARDELGTFEIANDWSHVRRKFIEAAPDYPVANEAVDLIAKLYDIEREAAAAEDLSMARRRLRKEKSRAATDEIKIWMRDHATSWTGSNLNRAIRYTTRRWNELTLFLDRPEVPLHNNASEFALRKPVRGRKNFHGTKSSDGARIASMAYTLCETARKHGISPTDYLREVFLRSYAVAGTVTLPTHLTN